MDMKHPETGHEMNEDEYDDKSEMLDDMIDHAKENGPEEHLSTLKSMKDEHDQYKAQDEPFHDHEGENDKEPEHPFEEPRTDAPENDHAIIIQFMKTKEKKDKSDKVSKEEK